VDANSIPIEHLKSEFKSRISFIHLVSSLTPEASVKLEAKGDIHQIGTWVDTAPEDELRIKAATVIELLDKLVAASQKRLPPKVDWQKIAAEHWQRLGSKEFSYSNGISCGWLAERFDCSRLSIPDDMPYHARIGVGHHAGNAAVEEDFLLRDAFFMLAKCQASLTRLENFRGELKTTTLAKSRYKVVSMFNQNVATYARYSVFGFYSFVECFVNSVGEDFIARNPKLATDKCELLRGKKDGRYLAVEKKLEIFPGIIRADGKRPIVLSDPKQIAEPYKSFASHVKDVRDSSAHFAKYKADIIVPPQTWEKRAQEASAACLAVARGFWNACYPSRSLPLYLGKLDDAKHKQIAERRVKTEMEEIQTK
jgi:hypothetical protein